MAEPPSEKKIGNLTFNIQLSSFRALMFGHTHFAVGTEMVTFDVPSS